MKNNKLIIGLSVLIVFILALAGLLIFVIVKPIINKDDSSKTETENTTEYIEETTTPAQTIKIEKEHLTAKHEYETLDSTSNDYSSLYGQGNIILSDEDFERYINLTQPSNPLASEEDLIAVISEVRNQYRQYEFYDGIQQLYDFFDKHTFEDNNLTREFFFLMSDSSIVSAFCEENADEEYLLKRVNDPETFVILTLRSRTPYKYAINPDGINIQGQFPFEDSGVFLSEEDSAKYFKKADFIFSEFSKYLYRFKIKYNEYLSLYVYVIETRDENMYYYGCEHLNGETVPIQQETVDIEGFGIDSGIYNDRE